MTAPAAAVLTISDAPLFLFAGRAFLSCELEELRAALMEVEQWHPLPPFFSRAEWEQALSISPLALQRESVRLFYHPNGAPCPPWQSVHTEESVLMGRSHHSALEWFRRAGMEPALHSEPADHIGLLLTFYARLLLEETEECHLEEFRTQHLDWLTRYCETLRVEARLDFYRLLGALTAELIAGFRSHT